MEQGQASTSSQNTYPWLHVDSFNSGSRCDHSSILFKDFMITFGGDTGVYPLNDIKILNLKNFVWQSMQVNGVTPSPRAGHSACLFHNNTVLIFGGHNYLSVMSSIFSLAIKDTQPFLLEWEQIRPAKGDDLFRVYHTTHVHEDYMYVFGGGDHEFQSTNEIWRFDLNNLNWENCKASGQIPGVSRSSCSFINGKTLFVFGGFRSQKRSLHNDFYMLNLETMIWQQITLKDEPISPRSGVSVNLFNNKVFFFGGYCYEGHSNQLISYDLITKEWGNVQTEGFIPSPRAYHRSIIYEGKIFIWGGQNKNHTLSDIFRLDLNPQDIKKNSTNKILIPRQSKFINQMKHLFLNKAYSDIIFQVEDQEFPAHRSILATRCRFFENMFSSNMKESHLSNIPVTDIKSSTFRALLEFIYCDEVEFKQDLNVTDLLVLADKYILSDLKETCESFIVHNVTMENYLEVGNVSEMIGSSEIEKAVLAFVFNNLDTLEKREDLYDLPKNILITIISKLKK